MLSRKIRGSGKSILNLGVTNDLTATTCSNGAVVPYPAPVVNNGVLVGCNPSPGTCLSTGVYVVSCRASNECGVVVGCEFDLRVVPGQDEPPQITCPTNIYRLCAHTNAVRVFYNATAVDDCDPAPTVTCTPPSGSLFPIGCSNVVCVAVDNAGNVSRCSFKVCVLRQGCYLLNPSFELLNANLPAPNGCGDPIHFAQFWTAVAGTPDLWRPPWASLVPGNCRAKTLFCPNAARAPPLPSTERGGFTSRLGQSRRE